MDFHHLQKKFPEITLANYRPTSAEDTQYNCIAWAAGANDVWWEPDTTFQYFWPLRAPRTYTLAAYMQAFGTMGYVPCADGDHEPDFEKISLYAKRGMPTHAARQIPGGWWTSKLGANIDIEHSHGALDNGEYGEIVQYMKRPIK